MKCLCVLFFAQRNYRAQASPKGLRVFWGDEDGAVLSLWLPAPAAVSDGRLQKEKTDTGTAERVAQQLLPVVTKRTGHTATVFTLALNDDDSTLVSGSQDCSISTSCLSRPLVFSSSRPRVLLCLGGRVGGAIYGDLATHRYGSCSVSRSIQTPNGWLNSRYPWVSRGLMMVTITGRGVTFAHPTASHREVNFNWNGRKSVYGRRAEKNQAEGASLRLRPAGNSARLRFEANLTCFAV